jgi:pyridoxal phosphate enzyme (YggS family)
MAIEDAIAKVKERIHAAALRAGRDPSGIRLMGVSKQQEVPALEAAWRGGVTLFGENRVQEALGKFSGFRELHRGVELHMIGSLQRNKAKTAVSLFDCIQSVDRDELIAELGRLTAGRETPLPILLELHTGETSKAGYPGEDALFRAAEKALAFPGLSLRGLMTMAPFTDDAALIRASFRALVKARDKLRVRFPLSGWPCLSMGMSNDYEIAVEEGSTLLRIGTALFRENTP